MKNLVEMLLKISEMLGEVLRLFQSRLSQVEGRTDVLSLQVQAQKPPSILCFQRLRSNAMLPAYAHTGDSGMDVYAMTYLATPTCKGMVFSHHVLQPGDRACFFIGWKIQVPEGYELQVRPKSGLALKQGLTVLNTPGTIDSSYRGEIGVILVNLGTEPVTIARGQKIAQLVLCPVITAVVQEVDSLDETERNDGGFGSTGV